MRLRRFGNMLGAAAAFTAVFVLGMLIGSPAGKAANDNDKDNNGAQDEKLMISQGFVIAPVSLKYKPKDHDMVGLGSYLVNVGDCNGCHTNSVSEFTVPGNPYLLKIPAGPYTGTPQINVGAYLGGGRDFGSLDPGGLSAHIVSRNLTPDKTGMPEGGHTLAQFTQIIRTGIDLDVGTHPTCPVAGPLNSGCVPFPLDGTKLQIMPWALLQNMTDRQLEAIYDYLSAVPCIAGPATGPLHNDCS
jgi:hypothetical protein